MKKYAIRVRKLLTNGREHGIIIFVLARLAQLVEHMLDVHGVTGSSPVPRTTKPLKPHGFKGFSFATFELELCSTRQKAPGPLRSRGFLSTGSVVKWQRFVRAAAALIRRSAQAEGPGNRRGAPAWRRRTA